MGEKDAAKDKIDVGDERPWSKVAVKAQVRALLEG